MFQARISFWSLFLFSALPCLSQTSGNKAPGDRIAPSFSLPTWNGQVLKLSDLKGSVVLLEFFQTECTNCQDAAPKLESLYKRYKNAGLMVVGVSFDKLTAASAAERAQAIGPFVKQYGLTFPVLLGDGPIWMNYIQKQGFNSPFIVFIDRKGRIVGQYEEGNDHKVHDADFLESQITKLLKEPR
jgi:peroxiredoxin